MYFTFFSVSIVNFKQVNVFWNYMVKIENTSHGNHNNSMSDNQNHVGYRTGYNSCHS